MALATSNRITPSGLSITDARAMLALCVVVVLSLAGCSGGSGGTDPLDAGGTEVPLAERRAIDHEQAFVYNPDAEYASVLKQCIVIREVNDQDPCPLVTLPFIGMDNPDPTIQDIMDRVLVTHQWMGERFEQTLRVMPQETLQLFAPITGILIGSNVDGIGNWSKYGRLRIDPTYLWLSNTEKTTIFQEQDTGSTTGSTTGTTTATTVEPRDAMKYDTRWRMLKDGQYAWESSDITGTNERTMRDLRLR